MNDARRYLSAIRTIAAWLILPAVLGGAVRAEEHATNGNPYARALEQYRIDLTSLPTDRFSAPLIRPLPPLDGAPIDPSDWPSDQTGGDDVPPEVLARLRKPFVDFAAEWEPEAGGFAIASYDLSAKLALPPIFGPPPPFLRTGFSFTDIDAPVVADLPGELYDVALGFDWVRRINDRWMVRLAFTPAYASDTKNNSSDAWQFRGAVLGIRQTGENWQLIVGAVASGRRDIPVFPGAGAIWTPSPDFRLNLTFPQPRASWRIYEDGQRQRWVYVGGGISGGTWAYQRAGGMDDVLTYSEWRVALGLETTPTKTPGMFIAPGVTAGVEMGYVFGREFEFEGPSPNIQLKDALLLRAKFGY